jgi:hypothetical protein
MESFPLADARPAPRPWSTALATRDCKGELGRIILLRTKPRFALWIISFFPSLRWSSFSDCVASEKRVEEATMSVPSTKKNSSHQNSHGKRKWSAAVTTDSTHPHAGLFNTGAKTIARELASRKVSPKGPSSGMRMLTFYINRAGKNLPENRLKVLEHAKKLLHEQIMAAKDQKKDRGGKEAAKKRAA